MTKAAEVLQEAVAGEETVSNVPVKVFRPKPKSVSDSVAREGDTFVITAPELERIITADTPDFGVSQQLKRRLTRLGVTRALQKAGIKPGDRVRCGDIEWDW